MRNETDIANEGILSTPFLFEIAFFSFLVIAWVLGLLESFYVIFRCSSLYDYFFAGDISVLLDREGLSAVGLKIFVKDINESDNGYCFLRVLELMDRVKFVKAVSAELRLEIYKRRAIKLADFISVMKSISLENSYTFYRRVYWGENVGGLVISSRLTNYVVPIISFYKARKVVDRNYFLGDLVDDLLLYFSALTVDDRIEILLDEEQHHMCRLDKRKYKPCGWHNLDKTVQVTQYFGAKF